MQTDIIKGSNLMQAHWKTATLKTKFSLKDNNRRSCFKRPFALFQNVFKAGRSVDFI